MSGDACPQRAFIFYKITHYGASNEYPQNIFSLKNKKKINILGWHEAPYLELWLRGISYT